MVDPPENGKGGALIDGRLVREFPWPYTPPGDSRLIGLQVTPTG